METNNIVDKNPFLMEWIIEAIKYCDVNKVRALLDTYPFLIHAKYDFDHDYASYQQYNLLLLFFTYYEINLAQTPGPKIRIRTSLRPRTVLGLDDRFSAMVELLLERGIDINYCEPVEGLNALMVFIKKCWMSEEDLTIVGILIDNDININHMNKMEENVLDMLMARTFEIECAHKTDQHYYLSDQWNWCQYQNAQLCMKMIVDAMINVERKRQKRIMKQMLDEQKAQLLDELYAPSGIGYQITKDRFDIKLREGLDNDRT